MTSNGNLPATREFVAERDFQIFQLRKEGVSHEEIGKRFALSTRAVGEAVKRQLARLNREALASYPEVLRLELERLDTLQDSIWRMTRHREETLHDGTIVILDPDLKAVDSVLKIMAQRARLLGIDAQKIDVKVSGETEVRHTMHGVEKPRTQESDIMIETRNFIELMITANMIKEEYGRGLLAEIDAEIDRQNGIIEGKVVEEGEENGQPDMGSSGSREENVEGETLDG